VHTFCGLAGHSFKSIEGVHNSNGATLQAIDGPGHFTGVLAVGWVARTRRVHHQPHCHLPSHIGREVNRGYLVHLIDEGLVDVVELDIASAETALAERTFGHGVERHELSAGPAIHSDVRRA
jgi:hypothetical protein